MTERLGFHSELYTLQNGDQISEFDGVNAKGLVVGRSLFPTEFSSNDSAWLFDPLTGGTQAIGLASPDLGPAIHDSVTAITSQDFVIGQSLDQDSQHWLPQKSSWRARFHPAPTTPWLA